MISVAIAFDCDAAVILTFDHEVDPKIAYFDLGVDSIASLNQQIVHLALKIGLALFPPVLGLLTIRREGHPEMVQQRAAKLIGMSKGFNVY
ncbi:hypothetical protein AN936_13190 [Sphingopyxis macrogoltabida]|uniref:Uncharacterized protein n=1 Tax=Sphingopyxis macrogoltabida TaxID=33050 RepID=A0A0N9U7L8_SPHMC|nr:hypothetical protein AN936_13190 [Sphingopyxis macrogoltabida]